MREDFLEALDKMFPDGYVIVYTNPNGDIRLSYYNPFRDKTLFTYYDTLLEFKDED